MESRLVPYQYYRFIELYKQFGGDEKKVDALVKPYGLSVAELKGNYERLLWQWRLRLCIGYAGRHRRDA